MKELDELDGKEIIKRYSLIGLFVGFAVLLLSYLVAFFVHDITISLIGVYDIHKANSLIILIDLLPLIFLFAGYFSGKIIQNRIEWANQQILNERQKSKKVLSFVKKLIENEFDVEYEMADKRDVLGKSLVNLRDNLKENKEQEMQRRKEDEQRNWVAEGLAKFSEILRNDNHDMELLSYNIISNLVKYLNANQGAFFILHDQENDKFFEMTSCFAYNRRKYPDKRVNWGEGLVGAAAKERHTVFMTEVPKDYITITSGLGKSNPRCLLIVPLIINEEIHGVIELASFHKFEKFEIEFIEKVAESIAATISSVKINIRTAKLLKESREQAEALATQEEQVRQNMEELQATQEEATRQAEKFVSFTNSVNHTLIRAEYSTDGLLLYANTKFLHKLGYISNTEVEGKPISIFINDKDREWFDAIWDNLSKGGKHFEGYMKHVTKQGQDLWTMATYTCVRKEDGSVDKVLFLAIDTTEQKKQSLDYEGQIFALDRSSLKADFSSEGEILDCNPKFLTAFAYQPEEIKDKNIYDLVDITEINKFKELWNEALAGNYFELQFKGVTKFGDEVWIRASFSAVRNMYDEVAKVVCIATDVTHEKIMEIENRKQNDLLKVQEEKLRQSGVELTRKLERAKMEMKMQFHEIEKIKIRNEKTLEGALDAIFTINQIGKIEFFNKAAEELWGFTRTEVLGQNIKMLFSNEQIKSDEFINHLVEPGENKQIGKRTEIRIKTKQGEDKNVLALLSDAKVENEHTFTAFIQNIEVELF